MAQPIRTTASWNERWSDQADEADKLVAFTLSNLFDDGDDHRDDPWCVDLGDSIVCMTSDEIRRAVHADELSTDVKVWRDGRGHWHAISLVDELCAEPVAEPETQPTVSRVRRRHRSWSDLAEPTEHVIVPHGALINRTEATILMAVTGIGVVLALLALATTWTQLELASRMATL
jgi:hypothetical protein